MINVKVIVFAVFAIFILFSSSQAYAGLLSFINDLASSNTESNTANGVPLTSASIELLSAPLSPSTEPATGGPDFVIENGALVATLSPVPLDQKIAPYQSDQISVYVVKEGDTLSEIAKMYGVTTNTIRWTNEIKYNNVIHVGQRLVILPITGTQYTVKDGDTLEKIAKSQKANAQEIADFNKIAIDAELAVGDTLIIPNGTDVAFVADQVGRSELSKTYTQDVTGYFINPVPGSVKTQGLHGHNAVDFGAPYGTSIRAAASGEVVIAKSSGYNGGYGKYVAILHGNGTQTLYAHMSAVYVTPGDWVTQGTTIGAVGSTGRSTGNHTHFEVRGARNPF